MLRFAPPKGDKIGITGDDLRHALSEVGVKVGGTGELGRIFSASSSKRPLALDMLLKSRYLGDSRGGTCPLPPAGILRISADGQP